MRGALDRLSYPYSSGSRYHKQFKSAAKQRYFVSQEDDVYFHSYMADYFLGTYGGGISKPFRYTEVKFIFNLKEGEFILCVRRSRSTCSS